jgi:hypothetical protein
MQQLYGIERSIFEELKIYQILIKFGVYWIVFFSKFRPQQKSRTRLNYSTYSCFTTQATKRIPSPLVFCCDL